MLEHMLTNCWGNSLEFWIPKLKYYLGLRRFSLIVLLVIDPRGWIAPRVYL